MPFFPAAFDNKTISGADEKEEDGKGIGVTMTASINRALLLTGVISPKPVVVTEIIVKYTTSRKLISPSLES